MPRRPALLAALLWMTTACGPAVESSTDGSTSSEPGTTESPSPESSSSSSGTPTDETTTSSSSTTSGGDSSTTAVVVPENCDVFMQDCPNGYKCAPIANDGGSAWNDTTCVPVVDDPAGIGEACSVQQITSPNGLDDCDVSSMCWPVDERTLEGTCIGLCTGSSNEPTCEDPDAVCVITSDGAFNPCLPTCDPLASDCDAGQVCVPLYPESFACTPGVESPGQLGEACEFTSACDQDLICVNPAPSLCEDLSGSGCCLPWCSVSAPDCPGETQCVSWWSEDPLPGYEDVGVCQDP